MMSALLLVIALAILWWLITSPPSNRIFAQTHSLDRRFELIVRRVDYGGSASPCPSDCGGIHIEIFLVDRRSLFNRTRRIRLPLVCGPEGSPKSCQEEIDALDWNKVLQAPTAETW